MLSQKVQKVRKVSFCCVNSDSWAARKRFSKFSIFLLRNHPNKFPSRKICKSDLQIAVKCTETIQALQRKKAFTFYRSHDFSLSFPTPWLIASTSIALLPKFKMLLFTFFLFQAIKFITKIFFFLLWIYDDLKNVGCVVLG